MILKKALDLSKNIDDYSPEYVAKNDRYHSLFTNRNLSLSGFTNILSL
jgi:hypothetical protein